MKPKDLVFYFGGVAQAAIAIGVHRRTIYHWLEQKEIPWRTQRLIELDTRGGLKAKKR